MVLTGSAAGCGSGLVAGWSAACQILAASRIIAIPQGSMNAMTMGPLADRGRLSPETHRQERCLSSPAGRYAR
jgi:hypothetical protein